MRYFIFSIFLSLHVFIFAQENKEIKYIDSLLNNWHLNATNTNFNAYFSFTSEDFVFIGTAPNEIWDKKSFMEFSKPYFDKGKAWDFKAINRKISLSPDGKSAWFYEVLDTWMRDCSGSGMLILTEDDWKLTQYDLHVLVENELMNEFLFLRKSKQK